MFLKIFPALFTTAINTSINWITVNPILFKNEIGIESDTLLYKIGDGINFWKDLPYSKSAINKLNAGLGIVIKDNIISANLRYEIIERHDDE